MTTANDNPAPRSLSSKEGSVPDEPNRVPEDRLTAEELARIAELGIDPANAGFGSVSANALAERGIDPLYARRHQLVEPVTSPDELPWGLRGKDIAPIPGMKFGWRHPIERDDIVWQYRPDKPVDPERKYLFEQGEHQNVALIREGKPDGPVLVIEGTMQSRAAARWASDDVTVLAVPGCWGWSHQGFADAGFSIVAGRPVFVVFDADTATNLDVYEAGMRLKDVLRSFGATEVLWPRLGLRGTDGIDDLLGRQRTDDARRTIVATLTKPSGAAVAKLRVPADQKPKRRIRKRDFDDSETFDGKDLVLVDADDTSLAQDWSGNGAGRKWFRWVPLEERWIEYRHGRWEDTGGSIVYSSIAERINFRAKAYTRAAAMETDPNTRNFYDRKAENLLSDGRVKAVMSRASGLSDLHTRPEELDAHPRLWNAGNGVLDLMDASFRTHDRDLMLTLGSDVVYDEKATCPRFDDFLAEILPDAEVRSFVLRVFGVAMFGEVRGNAHVFPVFIGEGRNGKGALIRIMSKLFGQYNVKIASTMLMERKIEVHSQEIAKLHRKRLATAEETAKNLTWDTGKIKSLTGGDELTGRYMRANDFDFMPSHTLVMSTNYRPNVSLDDTGFWMRYREIPFTVSVLGREDEGLEPYIIEHELPGVLNRVFAACQRYLAEGLAAPLAVRVASEEARAETNHLARFAEEKLVVTRDSDRDRIGNTDMYAEMKRWWKQNVRGEDPPSDRKFKPGMQSALGFAGDPKNPRYARMGGSSVRVWFGVRWADGGGSTDPSDLVDSDESIFTSSTASSTDAPTSSTASSTVGGDRSDGQTSDAAATGPVDDPAGGVDDVVDAIVDQASSVVAGQSTCVDDVDDVDDKSDLKTTQEKKRDTETPWTESDSHFCSMAESKGSNIVNSVNIVNTAPATPTAPPVVLDIETGDAKDLDARYGTAGFFRVGGLNQDGHYRHTTDVVDLADTAASSRLVVGHNLISFDLPVISREAPGRIDLLAMTRGRRVIDTMVLDSIVTPPGLGMKPAQAMKLYSLDASCERHGVPGKTDDLKALAKLHGGFDRIPVDDVDYLDYLRGDVAASRALGQRMFGYLDDYAWREMRVAAIAATMTASGFLADQDLLQRRYWQVQGRKASIARRLIARYGLPTTKSDGKPAESPHATKEGKEALLAAFTSLGVDVEDIPTTPKGAPSFGREAMGELADTYDEHPDVVALCGVVADMAGQRTVYGTALEYLAPDGRVHPEVKMLQASGRWSVTNPGLTVFGKRGGKVVERAIFRPAPGNVLLAADLSQIDARAIAVHSQDDGYLALFQPGLDAHEIVGRMVWGDAAYDSDPKGHRDKVKAITHGVPYGMGVPKLALNAGVPESVAQQVVDTMNERFPRLQEWKQEVREQAADGEMLDNGFGRLMRPDPDRAYTQSVALMGQGTARDLMMECLLRLPDEIVRMLRAQVHDEIVIECPEADEPEVREALREAMTFEWAPPGADHPVQIVADCSPAGRNWAHCYRKD